MKIFIKFIILISLNFAVFSNDFSINEQFNYSIMLGSLSIGNASITSYDYNKDTYKIVCSLTVKPFISLFFKFNSESISFCSKKDFNTFKYYENTFLKGKRYQFVIVQNKKNRSATIYKFKHQNYIHTKKTEKIIKGLNIKNELRPIKRFNAINIDPKITDPISVLFKYRKILTPKDSTIEVLLDFVDYKMPVKYHGIQKIYSYAGKFNTFMVCPEIKIRSILPENSNVFFYFSTDKNKIPVMVKYNIPFFGSGRAILTSYKINSNI